MHFVMPLSYCGQKDKKVWRIDVGSFLDKSFLLFFLAILGVELRDLH
jgi:hypothetical protein